MSSKVLIQEGLFNIFRRSISIVDTEDVSIKYKNISNSFGCSFTVIELKHEEDNFIF